MKPYTRVDAATTVTRPFPRLDRTTFTTSRLLDFFTDKELTTQTGHGLYDWPLVAVKELFDNSLDACEEADVPPAITVTVDQHGITVTDNGPGIPAETIEGAMDFDVRVSSRDGYVSPTRGAQGNALKTLLAMPFVLDGNAGTVEIAARGQRHRIDVQVDHIEQAPRIVRTTTQDSKCKKGTSVTIRWPDSARSLLDDAKPRFLQLVSSFGWLNPHLTVNLDWGGARELNIAATDAAWKKWRPRDPTSPHWYEVSHFERLITGYLAADRTTGRIRTVRDVVAEFRGLTGSAKQKAVLGAAGLRGATLEDLVIKGEVDHRTVERLLAFMRTSSTPVQAEALGPIGKEHIGQMMEADGCDPQTFHYRLIKDLTRGLPTLVEVGFAVHMAALDQHGQQPSRKLVTGVNWSGGINNPFRDLGDSGDGLDVLLEELEAGRDEPVVMLVHLACPRVEFTDRGKSSLILGHHPDHQEVANAA
jgi:DNA topoisomerase VI subunit B